MLSTAALLGALVSFASALPLAPLDDVSAGLDLTRRAYSTTAPPAQLIDYFPRFTSPAAGDVYQAGGSIQISWNATKPNYPENQIHQSAVVILGYLDPEDPSSGYNLDMQHPLGNVSFYSGSGSVSLPLPANLTTRSTYLLTMGSTRNISPLFTIQGSSSDTSGSSSSSSAAPTSSSAAASVSNSAQIQSLSAKPLTVYFPDGSTTVVGGPTAAASSAAKGTSTGTSLNDIAAPSSSASSSAAKQATPSLAQAGAAASPSSSTTTTSTSGAGSLALTSRQSALGLVLGAALAVGMVL